MGKTYTLGLAGESFKNPDGSSRQVEIGRCRAGETVTLIRDPQNQHDANAIMALSRRGVGIGMVARDNAEWLAAIMDKGRPVEARIKEVCQAPGTRSKGIVIDCLIDGGAPGEPKSFFARILGL